MTGAWQGRKLDPVLIRLNGIDSFPLSLGWNLYQMFVCLSAPASCANDQSMTVLVSWHPRLLSVLHGVLSFCNNTRLDCHGSGTKSTLTTLLVSYFLLAPCVLQRFNIIAAYFVMCLVFYYYFALIMTRNFFSSSCTQ